jgi:predicted small secreted protein
MNPNYLLKNVLWVCIIGIFLMMLLLTGCSTVAGVGKDIQDSATWTKEKMGGSK